MNVPKEYGHEWHYKSKIRAAHTMNNGEELMHCKVRSGLSGEMDLNPG